jgi:hypothetical protein
MKTRAGLEVVAYPVFDSVKGTYTGWVSGLDDTDEFVIWNCWGVALNKSHEYSLSTTWLLAVRSAHEDSTTQPS